MARKNKTLGKLLIVAGLGLGGYYLYKVGDDKGWWASLFPNSNSASNPQPTPSPGGGGDAADPVQTAVDTALGFLGWLQTNNGTVATVVDSLTDTGNPIDEVPADTSPTPGTPDAAKAAWNAFGIALPIWLGTSKQAAELTHQANVALTHAIGQETGLDKGIRTLFTSHGAFLVNSVTHQCYNLTGHKITCPAADDVTGIEKHSYEAFLAGVKK